MGPPRLIRILQLEDVAHDAEAIHTILKQAGLNIHVQLVDGEQDFRARLATPETLDIILSDFVLPTFDGLSALMLRSMLAPELPFIFVTGSPGEERAVEMLHIGASDYVLKDNLSRLPMAVLRALAEADAARIQAGMQLQLEREQQRLSAVLTTSGALIVLVDSHGAILLLNPAAAQATGLSSAQAERCPYTELFCARNEARQIEARFASLHAMPPGQHVAWRATVNQRIVQWTAACLPEPGITAGFAVISGIDVTAQERAEQQAYYLRNFDSITGLPNRELLRLRLEANGQGAPGKKKVLVMIGVARLQDVRDSMGETFANHLLCEVAHRLQHWSDDCLARMGDDSFAVLLDTQDDASLKTALSEMLNLLHQPYLLDQRSFFLTAHFGVTPLELLTNPDEILQAATMTLHRAMQRHGERFHFYQPLLSDEARARMELEGELHVALRSHNQLILHYQPQVDIRSGRIIGLEALIRWNHPRLGLISPGRFIPLAESCGLIVALGELALNMACRQSAAWQRTGLPAVSVAVNLSAVQWSRVDLANTIRQALTTSGLAPQWLELELTESASMHDPLATLDTMKQLRAMGVQVSIDDFGTGFCNLSYLKRFPVDKLKIDQSFVREMTSLPDDLVIAQMVVAMGHLLRLKVVAEGVETEGQLNLLAEAGCDTIQGYYFSRPVDPETCARLLAGGATMPATKRRVAHNTVLWFDPSGTSLNLCAPWLDSLDAYILGATTSGDAFELLATHEVRVAVAAQSGPEISGSDFLSRVSQMYPDIGTILLADERGDQCGIMPLHPPQTPQALLAALGQALARSRAAPDADSSPPPRRSRTRPPATGSNAFRQPETG